MEAGARTAGRHTHKGCQTLAKSAAEIVVLEKGRGLGLEAMPDMMYAGGTEGQDISIQLPELSLHEQVIKRWAGAAAGGAAVGRCRRAAAGGATVTRGKQTQPGTLSIAGHTGERCKAVLEARRGHAVRWA